MTVEATAAAKTVDIRVDRDVAFAWAQLRQAKEREAAAKRDVESARAVFDRLIADRETLTADGQELAYYRYDGAFSSKRFNEEMPHLAEKYTKWHAESYLDTEAIERDHPVLYKQYRARTLRTAKGAS